MLSVLSDDQLPRAHRALIILRLDHRASFAAQRLRKVMREARRSVTLASLCTHCVLSIIALSAEITKASS